MFLQNHNTSSSYYITIQNNRVSKKCKNWVSKRNCVSKKWKLIESATSKGPIHYGPISVNVVTSTEWQFSWKKRCNFSLRRVTGILGFGGFLFFANCVLWCPHKSQCENIGMKIFYVLLYAEQCLIQNYLLP